MNRSRATTTSRPRNATTRGRACRPGGPIPGESGLTSVRWVIGPWLSWVHEGKPFGQARCGAPRSESEARRDPSRVRLAARVARSGPDRRAAGRDEVELGQRLLAWTSFGSGAYPSEASVAWPSVRAQYRNDTRAWPLSAFGLVLVDEQVRVRRDRIRVRAGAVDDRGLAEVGREGRATAASAAAVTPSVEPGTNCAVRVLDVGRGQLAWLMRS